MTARQEQPRVLLVLGMHRSGTSAATRVVNLLGADLGNNLIEPGADNPDGFWEHAEAVRINDALLEGLGRTWYDMREMPQDWQSTEAAGDALAQIETLIRQDFRPGSLWAIKDPRMCLTAPIWIRALRGLGYSVDCLFVVRNPREVVDSLHVRNNWVRGPLYLMWVQYLMEAEAASRDERRTLITYDELLADWRGTMERVAAELGLVWPVTLEAAAAEVHAFLNKGRRHHVADSEDATGETGDADNDVPELASKLYQACLSISRDEKTWSAISRLEKTYRSVAGLYAEHVDQLINLRWQAEARAQVAEARAASLSTVPEVEINAVTYEKLAEDIGKSISGSHDLLAQKIGTIVNAMAGGMDHLGLGFVALQKELREKAHKDEEREVASEARMGALENTFYDLSKRTAATEVQFATVAGEMKARIEHQQSVLAELGTTCGSLAGQLDVLRASAQNQAHILGESLDRVLPQVELRLAALDTELKTHVSNVAESSANALDQVKQRLVALDVALRANEQSEAESAASTMQHIEGVANELRTRLADMQDTQGKRDIQIDRLLVELDNRETKIHQLESSTSWRITAPLRWIRKALSPRAWKATLGRSVKFCYERLPLPTHRRLALKSKVFRTLAPLIRNTRSYRAWRAFEDHRGIGPAMMQVGGMPTAPSSSSIQPQQYSGSAGDPTSSLASRVLNGLNEVASGTSGEYIAMDDKPADLSRIDVRAIAFYLPQFHPIPENDAWWGRGFTEWTNVSKAVPQFVGHYQPRLPGELGFYDLRLVDVMRRQVELAKHYGLQGFCFHYYWFGGRRLLERPLEQLLANTDIDFPFCICWANENWSRRWDGMDQDILIGQDHSPEDDMAFITALEPVLRDPRYIRVDGKPLLVVYRPAILPDAKATQERWREHCRKVGIGEIVLAMVQFDVEDPRVFGFDVAIEFPPHKLARGLEPINDKLDIVNPGYSGYVVDYDAVIERAREHTAVDFQMIRGVFPSWDNEARKPGRGYTFANATPARYREWMDLAINYARKHPVAGERMVFINAWNEWAEGAHLEPDRRYGYAFLDQTRAALLNSAHGLFDGRRIVIVSHDAHPHGAQYLALNMARVYRQTFNFRVDVILCGEGPLVSEFSRWATVHDLSSCAPDGDEAKDLAEDLYRAGVRQVIANTTVTGLLVKTLKRVGMTVVSLVHEQAGVIRDNRLLAHAQAIAEYADCIVFPAEQVHREFSSCANVPKGKTIIRPQGLYKINRYSSSNGCAAAREQLRLELGITPDARVVLCVGYADHRKGVDLFVESGIRLMQRRGDVHYVWVGHADVRLQPQIEDRVRDSGFAERFHFVGRKSDTDAYYAGADVYALTSREDPFPSVVMESLQAGVPVIGFQGAGGFTELLARDCGRIVPMVDVASLTDTIAELIDDEELARSLGRRGRALIDAHYNFRSYLFDLLDIVRAPLPKVSVIVPNYNYAIYLESRINSILDQTVPFYELIILDDASTDNSVAVIERLAAERGFHLRLVSNQINSGSAFKQWEKGVDLARGEFVWIAEADDLAEPDFLASVVSAMSDPDVVMAYCESKQIDAGGCLLAENYHDYVSDVSADQWRKSHRRSGRLEIESHLAIKNTVPNVSAVVFRRDALKAAITRESASLSKFKVAGDWLVYTAVMEQGDVCFVSDALNRHRRHKSSITIGGDNRPHMTEVLRMQRLVRERYSVSENVLRVATAYTTKLGEYFNLSDDDVARLAAEVDREFERRM